jgi:acyl-CoA dehydrogenase
MSVVSVDHTSLTDEQKAIREMAHDFAENEIRPVAWELDKDATWPAEILEKGWELGLMNSQIPAEYGGPGMGHLDGALIEEEMGWGCSGVATSMSCNGLAAMPIVLGGTEAQKKQWLGRLTEAPVFASFALTEPDAGSDVSGMKTTAVRRGDAYVINGSKCFITNGEYADFYTVFAKTDRDAGHRGISCIVVPRAAGVIIDKHEDKMGQRASNTATITFNDLEVPAENLIGEENKGFKLAMATLDSTRPGVAAMATGVSRAALEMAIEYSRERVQFGVPIAMHQAVSFLIADMATKVHLSRLATHHAARLMDAGVRSTLESSHAKRYAADSCMEVTTDAVQVFGGYGYIKEYKVEKLMRDAKLMQLYEGTAQVQRLVEPSFSVAVTVRSVVVMMSACRLAWWLKPRRSHSASLIAASSPV